MYSRWRILCLSVQSRAMLCLRRDGRRSAGEPGRRCRRILWRNQFYFLYRRHSLILFEHIVKINCRYLVVSQSHFRGMPKWLFSFPSPPVDETGYSPDSHTLVICFLFLCEALRKTYIYGR